MGRQLARAVGLTHGPVTPWLKRLKRDRPDLAERVVAGEMSADPVDLDQRSPRQTGAPRERRPPLPAPPAARGRWVLARPFMR